MNWLNRTVSEFTDSTHDVEAILRVPYLSNHHQLWRPGTRPSPRGRYTTTVCGAPPVRTLRPFPRNRPVRREKAERYGAGRPAPGPRVPLDPTVDYARPLLIYRRDVMPVRRGHVAPQTTFVDSIIRKFEGLSEYQHPLLLLFANFCKL